MTQAPAPDLPAPSPPILELAPDRATIRLNRPRHRNRIERGDVDVLCELLTSVDLNPDLRVLVLTGAGSTFCAGYDLGALKTEAAEAATAAPGPDLFERMVDQLEELRIPTICALNGGVYGGATDLALACDFRIGVEGMELGMHASRLGVHYYLSGLRRYVQPLGLGPAKRLFSGRADKRGGLLEIGYLDELVAAGEPRGGGADAPAATRKPRAPLAVQGMKWALNAVARALPTPRKVDAGGHPLHALGGPARPGVAGKRTGVRGR